MMNIVDIFKSVDVANIQVGIQLLDGLSEEEFFGQLVKWYDYHQEKGKEKKGGGIMEMIDYDNKHKGFVTYYSKLQDKEVHSEVRIHNLLVGNRNTYSQLSQSHLKSYLTGRKMTLVFNHYRIRFIEQWGLLGKEETTCLVGRCHESNLPWLPWKDDYKSFFIQKGKKKIIQSLKTMFDEAGD
jgi:hypothetical protein